MNDLRRVFEPAGYGHFEAKTGRSPKLDGEPTELPPANRYLGGTLLLVRRPLLESCTSSMR